MRISDNALAGNKAKRHSSVHHTVKTIRHHYHHHQFQVPEKSLHSCKIKTKNIFWAQIGSKLPTWDRLKGSSQILTQPIIGPSIYTFWMSSINIRVFAVFDFRQKKPLRFFWFSAHLSPFFFRGGGNIPSKPPQTKLNFWLQVVLIVKWISFKAFEELEFLHWQDLPKVWYFSSKFDCNFPPENGWNQK